MILIVYLLLLVVVNAANYKFYYVNDEFVQSAGGKGQYARIGGEVTVIQWIVPDGKELTISDPIEFPDFGVVGPATYHYVFGLSTGGDIKVACNGVDEITLYRSSNPPQTQPGSATCPGNPGYLYAHRKWLRQYSRIRGRGVRRLLSTTNTIKLGLSAWGEPHFGALNHYVEIEQVDDIQLDLTDIGDEYPHNLIKPNGELHTALKPGELNIIKAPHSVGNYSIEAPSVWGDYVHPVIHVRRKLHEWGGHKHPKLMAGETWSNVCPNIVEGQYAIGAGASAVAGCSDSNFPSGAHPKSTSASCSGSADSLNCATGYTITATCTYTWKMDYTSNEAKCGTDSVTEANADECGCSCTVSVASTCSSGWYGCNDGACSDDCPSGFSYPPGYGGGSQGSDWKYCGSTWDTQCWCVDTGSPSCTTNQASTDCNACNNAAATCTFNEAKSCTVDESATTTQALTATTTACPVQCVGAWSAWGTCGVTQWGNAQKQRTYTQSTVAAYGGDDCATADGTVHTIDCITAQPTFVSQQADGSEDSSGRLTVELKLSITTTHAESVICAGLATGTTVSVSAITNAEDKVSFVTTSATATEATITGLSDETDYDIACTIGTGWSDTIDKLTPDLFAVVGDAEMSGVGATVGTCSSSWTDAADARCVAMGTGDTCSWDEIKDLGQSGPTPLAVQTTDLTTKAFSFTGLTAATSYKCCCHSSHGTTDAGSSVNFDTLGFTADLAVDSKTTGSVTFTVAVKVLASVTCTVQTKADWDAAATATTAETMTYTPSALSENKEFTGLKHYTQYYIKCTQSTDSKQVEVITEAPTFSPQPAASDHTMTGFTVKATIDRDETIVCSVFAEDETATLAAIIEGTGASSTSGELSISKDTEKSIQITGLVYGTTYDVYCALKGDDDTYDGPYHTKSDLLQTATVQPSITAQPTASEITYDSFKITTTYDHAKMSRCVAVAADASAPTAADLATDFTGTVAYVESNSVANTPHVTIAIDVGCCGTAYDVYCGQTDFDIISNALRVTTVQPTIAQPIVITEATSAIKIEVTFDHTNDAACVLVPRDAAAPSIAHVFSGQGAVEFYSVKAHITAFTPTCAGTESWSTECNTAVKTELWFGNSGAGTEPTLGKLEDDQEYDAYCAQEDTEVLSAKKQVVTIKETITSDLAISDIAWNTATFAVTFSDPGNARCTVEYDSSTAPTITQILDAKAQDGGAALGNTDVVAVTADTSWTESFDDDDIIDCVVYDVFCAHDDGGDEGIDGLFAEADFTTTCKTITTETALSSGYTMETDPTHQIKLPLTAWDRVTVETTFDHADPARCVLLAKDETAPTLTQIFTGTDGDDDAAIVVADQGDSLAATAFAATFIGLSDNTDYHVYCAQGAEPTAQQSANNKEALISGPFLVRTVEKRITTELEPGDGYVMETDGIQIKTPLTATDTVSVRIKFSHTDPVQCMVTKFTDDAPTLAQIFNKHGHEDASIDEEVSGEFGSYVTPDQGTATAATFYVQEITGLEEGHKYIAYCAQAKLDDPKNVVSSFTFATASKKITAAMALGDDNNVLGCADGEDPDCPGEDAQIKLPAVFDTVVMTITYSHAGTVRCAALLKDRAIPTNKELQDGITLEDYESSPDAVNNTADTQVVVTFTGLQDSTEYDFFCVQDRYDTAVDSQVLRNSKLTYRTVPKVFQEEPSVDELGHYGLQVKFKMSHEDDGRCVVVPAVNVATYDSCMDGEGVVASDEETFAAETEVTVRIETGLEDNTDYKVFCCQGRQLISTGIAFTTLESPRVIQDTHVTEILDTTASVSVGFSDYEEVACFVRPITGTLPTEAEILGGITTANGDAHEITAHVSTDTFFIEDNNELLTWYMGGEVNPNITLTQWSTYTFVRTTPGHDLRIVAAEDCADCGSGTYTTLGTSDIADVKHGLPVHWRPTESGTYYYVSTTAARMVGVITVTAATEPTAAAVVVAAALVECDYPEVTDMPENQTLPTKLTGCAQPDKLVWKSPYDSYYIINPYREKPTLAIASLDVKGWPAKIAYNTYNQNATLETAGKSFNFDGLTTDTKYEAICGAKGTEGEFAMSSLVSFRTLYKPGRVTMSLADPEDAKFLPGGNPGPLPYGLRTGSFPEIEGAFDQVGYVDERSILPQPLGQIGLTSDEAAPGIYIVFTTDGSEPDCDQEIHIIPSAGGNTSRVHQNQTLRYRACSELSGDEGYLDGDGNEVQGTLFYMKCKTDWYNLPEPYTSDIDTYPKYTNVPAYVPLRADNGFPQKCTMTNIYTGKLQSACEDAGNFFLATFENATCEAKISGVGVIDDGNCDDGGPNSDYSDCPFGTDAAGPMTEDKSLGCPAREIDGFCLNSCKFVCEPCPRIPLVVPFCGHNPDGTQKAWECPELEVNADPVTGLCPDECPRVCKKCPYDAPALGEAPSCGITGWDSEVGYHSLDNHPCLEGDPENPDTEGKDVDFQKLVCEDTCASANDGVCDETENNCDPGTDCTDCGGEGTIVTSDYCPSGCLPVCDACPRIMPAPVCDGRDRPCPESRNVEYNYANKETPPSCADSCFPHCFQCPVFVTEEEYTVCPSGEAPCSYFEDLSNNVSCHGEWTDEGYECSGENSRPKCPIGCPSRCYHCPTIPAGITQAPKCRQLPAQQEQTGCGSFTTVQSFNVQLNLTCDDGSDSPCYDMASLSTLTEQEQQQTLLVAFQQRKCPDGCPVACEMCGFLPDPYPSCGEDRLGQAAVIKCYDGSLSEDHKCFEDRTKTTDCKYGVDPVCGDGCGFQCKSCRIRYNAGLFSKCDNDAVPCPDGGDPYAWDGVEGEGELGDLSGLVETFSPFYYKNFLDSSYDIYCPSDCKVECYSCPSQTLTDGTLPRCGSTGIPCPEDPDDKPILLNVSDPLSTNCTDSLCPILCEQCPDALDPLPKCVNDASPCRDGVVPSCEDGSAGYDLACDNGDRPICTDLCVGECDHCEVVDDPLPKCGQFNDGNHSRKPCLDDSDENGDGRCADACLPGCEACTDRAASPPMCGKNEDNSDILQVCEDGTLGSALDVEGLCADGCATQCIKCGDIASVSLSKCGQNVDGTNARVRCDDDSDETENDGVCADTCRPTCDYCTAVTIPQPRCGRNPDGSQKDFECSDNLPIGENGLCSDGCAPLCTPCPDIVSGYIICEAEQEACEDGSGAVCATADGTPAPVIWESSQLAGTTVCPETDNPHPRCDDLCTPVCITATCDQCDSSKSFLKVEDFDQHVNGYPTQQIIQTNGIPIHPMEPYPDGGWPAETYIGNIIDINGYTAQDFAAAASGTCPFCTKFQLPKYAEKGTQFWELEPDVDVGISTFTGAYLYNHYHGTDDVAVQLYGTQLDYCSGHATNDCVYHYSAYPSCVQGYVGNCGLIGYLYDGLPVLSTCKINNVELSSCYKLKEGSDGTKTSHYDFDEDGNCHLDMANGYDFDEGDISWLQGRGVALSTIKNFNGYAYVMTNNYPWMMPGFYGTQWGGMGCPKAFTNEWTPQGECVEVSPLCVEGLLTRTPQECDCTDDTWCVETGYDTAVQYYNRRPPVISKVDFTSIQSIINSDSTIQVMVQVSKPIVKAESILILNWEGLDADDQLMEFEYTEESTMSDGVTKQFFWAIPTSNLTNVPTEGPRTLIINHGSGVEDDSQQRTGFLADNGLVYENACKPDYDAIGYNLDACVSASGAAMRSTECVIDCNPGGYAFENQTVSKECETEGGTFIFKGCSARCIAPPVAPSYNFTECDTSDGPIAEGLCTVSCSDGFTEASGGTTTTCPGDGQVFQLTGCNAQCTIDSTLDNPAYDLTNCPHDGGLIGNCEVGCSTNYDGNPVIACENGGQPWNIITGFCEAVCIAPTTEGYELDAPATQNKALLTCSAGYELSAFSNSIFPVYSCPGAGLAFSASGCAIACQPDFDATIDTSDCYRDGGMVRNDECNLKCMDGYGACSGTVCSDPQPICTTAGAVFGQTLTCEPACSLPNDPDFLTKYNLANCPGPVYTEESCSLSCAGGFSSNGQVSVSCNNPGGTIDITNECSSACTVSNPADYLEYDLTNCDTSGGALTEFECNPTCLAGYIAGEAGVRAKCSLDTMPFSFTGCSSSNCDNTPSIVCDDGITCTEDICDPGSIIYDIADASATQAGCYHVPSAQLCEDEYGCTDNACTPDAPGADVNGCTISMNNGKCDDGVDCTADVCSPYEESATSAGCIFTTDDSQCDDSSICTIDICVIGQGCTNEPIVCEDNIFCTVDSCDPVLGCVHTAEDSLCTDEWPCTLDVCDIAAGTCVHTDDDSMCTDAYDCTIDKCALGVNAGPDGCTHELDNSVCDDGASCSSNLCAPLSSEDSTGCYNSYDNTVCEDGVACTRDTCTPTNENATAVTGCLNQNICGIDNPACTLDLEINEDGLVIKPYIPCVEGKTFSSCETVQVTLIERKEEIKVRENTEIENYLASIADNPPSVCNPNPCLGTNSTCEILTNETNNATRFNCTCPEGQRGDRCEFLAVSEDTEAPKYWAYRILIGFGIALGAVIGINLASSIAASNQDTKIINQAREIQAVLSSRQRPRKNKKFINKYNN